MDKIQSVLRYIKKNYGKFLLYILLIFLASLSILPFWLMFANSTRSTAEINQGLSLLPSSYLGHNWDALTGRGFSIFQGFINSLIISVGVTSLSLYFSALTAYSLVIYRFPGRKTLGTLILFMIMIPSQLTIVGFYNQMDAFGLTDTRIPLILPAIATPSTVYFLRQYLYGNTEFEIVESGRVEGATEFGIYNKIMLPLMAPGLATMGIFAFVFSWNNFLTPSIMLVSEELYTLPLLVNQLNADIYSTELGGIYLGLSMSVFPLIIAYLLLSKYIVAGVSAGGVKG